MSESLGLWFKLGVCTQLLWPTWQRPSPPSPLFQDALLSLGSVIDVAGLHRAVKEALSAVLPRVVGAQLRTTPAPQTCAQLLAAPHTRSSGKGEKGLLPRGFSWGSEGVG